MGPAIQQRRQEPGDIPAARGGREVWQVEQDRDAEARRDDCAPVIRQGGEDPPRQT